MAKLYPTPSQLTRVGVWPPPAADPGLVLATTKPGWPAPEPKQVPEDIDARAPRVIPAGRALPAEVVSESIFGGPVTPGDPDVVTLTTSPYTDKVEPLRPSLSPDEGWIDIFGQVHGTKVPRGVRGYSGWRGRGRHVPAYDGFGTEQQPGMSTPTKVAIGAAVVLGALFAASKLMKR